MIFIHEPYKFDVIEQVTDFNGKRYYVTPKGDQYPSITTMLKILSDAGIKQWREKVGAKQADFISNAASSRGKELHLIVEKYLLNEGIIHSANPLTLDMFMSMKIVLDASVNIVHNQEFSVYSNILKCAGTADLLCTWNSKLTIADFKTSKKKKREEWIENYFLQAAMYAACIYEMTKIKVPQLVILIGVDDSLPQLFVKKTKDYIKPALDFIDKYYHETSN